MKNCACCSVPLLPSSRARYCSPACRQLSYRQRHYCSYRTSLIQITNLVQAVQPYELRHNILLALNSLPQRP